MIIIYGPPKMLTRKCVWCKKPFLAREVDVNRGRGRFCSTNCKATRQIAQDKGGPILKARILRADKFIDKAVANEQDNLTFTEYEEEDQLSVKRRNHK